MESKMKELSAMCIVGLLADFLSHDKFMMSLEMRSDIKELQESISSFAKTWQINLNLQKPSSKVKYVFNILSFYYKILSSNEHRV